MSEISQRLQQLNASVTLKVDAKGKALKAEGKPVISYAAGEPDFATPANIVEAARKALDDPKNFKYTQNTGLPQLREAIAAKTARDSGLTVDPSQVIVTNGGKQAVYEAFQVVLDPGDEVLVPAPYWTTYPEAIGLTGATQVDVFAGADQQYLVTVEQLEAARTERTKALVMVSPSNPTGAVYSEEQIRAIGQWALEHKLWVIADEIYQNLTYDGMRAVSIVEAVPELAERTLLVNGMAKTYAMTGWRVGWMVGPQEAVDAAAKLQSHLTSNVNNIAQIAAAEGLSGPQDAVEEFRAAFDRRRGLILSALREIPGVEVPTPKGAFYVYADVQGLLGREWRGRQVNTSLELSDLMLDEALVSAVPGEAFGPGGYIRFSYALGDDQLVEGITRLQQLFSE